MTFRRVLVGWDGSGPATAALLLAVAHAKEVDGEVEALVVFNKTGPSRAKGEQADDPERRDVQQKLATVLDSRQVRFHAIVEETSPAHALARFASDHGFELIAVGRRSVGRDGDGTLHALAAQTQVPLFVVGTDGRGELLDVNRARAMVRARSCGWATPLEP